MRVIGELRTRKQGIMALHILQYVVCSAIGELPCMSCVQRRIDNPQMSVFDRLELSATKYSRTFGTLSVLQSIRRLKHCAHSNKGSKVRIVGHKNHIINTMSSIRENFRSFVNWKDNVLFRIRRKGVRTSKGCINQGQELN